MNSFGSSTPRAGAPVGAVRRRAVVDALRRGAVPESGLDLLATGLSRFEQAVDEELGTVAMRRLGVQGSAR